MDKGRAAAVDRVTTENESCFKQPPRTQPEYHWTPTPPSNIPLEEQQAPSPPTPPSSLLSFLPRRGRGWAASPTATATATAAATAATIVADITVARPIVESPHPAVSDEEERQDRADSNMPPTAAAAAAPTAAATPHPWRRDLAFKQNVNSRQQQQQQQQQHASSESSTGAGSSSSSSESSTSRYRTSYRTLLQQRKQVFERITIQEEGENNKNTSSSFTLDEGAEDEEDEHCSNADEVSLGSGLQPPTQHQQQQQQRGPESFTSILPPTSSNLGGNPNHRMHNNDDISDDCLSLGMSMQSSINRNAIRTLLQQEIKVRVQQIYTGDFYCVVGTSENDGQPYHHHRKTSFGRHGRPLDHPIFSPRFVRLQDELKNRLQRVYTANHFIVETMGGMTADAQTKMAKSVHQQALSQVLLEFNEKLKSLRHNIPRQDLHGAGFSCWDDNEHEDEEEDSDNDDCCSSDEDDDDDDDEPRLRHGGGSRGSAGQRLTSPPCPDDEPASAAALEDGDNGDECPLDECCGRLVSKPTTMTTSGLPTRGSVLRGLASSLCSRGNNDKKHINSTDAGDEHLEPTNSMTDEDEEDAIIVVTEYSAPGKQQAQQQQQAAAAAGGDESSEWDEYTIDTTVMEDMSTSRSLRNGAARPAAAAKVKKNQSTTLMTKSRMFNDFSVDQVPPPRKPQQQHHLQAVDDDEYTEYTIQSSVLPDRGPPTATAAAAVNDNDEWDEYTVQSASVAPRATAAANNGNDDDEWDEYTIQSTAVSQASSKKAAAVRQEQAARMMKNSRMFSDFNPQNMDQNTSRQVVLPQQQQQQQLQKQPDDDEYTEYTIQSAQVPFTAQKATATLAPAVSKIIDQEWDEYTVQDSVAAGSVVEESQAARQRQLQLLNRSRFAREQAAKAAREGGGSPRSSPQSTSSETCTIRKQAPPAVVPAVVIPPRKGQDGEWEEYTIQEDETMQSNSRFDHHRNSRNTMFSSNPYSPPAANPTSISNVKSSPASALASKSPPAPRAMGNDDEWEEYTIQETVAHAAAAAPLVDTSAFGHSRMFSNFDPQSSSVGNNNQDVVVHDEDFSDNDDDDDEMTAEQYIHCRGDASVVSAFTMEPGWHQQEEANRRRQQQFCATTPRSPKSTSQGGTKTAPTCDASSADSSNQNNNKAATMTTTRSVVSTSQCSATTNGSSCNVAGSKRIAELLRRDIWSKNEKVVHKAMLELLFDAAQGPECCARIVRYGGPLAIMCAMEANPNHVDIQIAACGTMEQLAAAGNNIDVVASSNGRNAVAGGEQPPPPSDHRVTLGEVGAVQSVVTAMKADLGHVELQRVACSALVNLTHHGALNDISLDGAVEAVTKALTRHTSDPTIQEMAFIALGNLCMENTTRLEELSQVGGLAAMTTALQRPWKNPMEKQGAISTLSMLLRAQAELC